MCELLYRKDKRASKASGLGDWELGDWLFVDTGWRLDCNQRAALGCLLLTQTTTHCRYRSCASPSGPLAQGNLPSAPRRLSTSCPNRIAPQSCIAT